MLGRDQLDSVAGREVYGADGAKIGTARQVYTEDQIEYQSGGQTGEPAWVTVRTGLCGLKESFLPLHHAELSGDRVTVPYTRDVVKDAPAVDEDGHLTPDEERELFAFYFERMGEDERPPELGRTGRGDYQGSRTGRGTYDAERTGRRPTGRARLRKHGMTEPDFDEDTRGYN